MTGKEIVKLAKDTFTEFNEDEATWKAAALSYFTVFALAPLLVILLQVASFIWDPAQVRDALTGQFQALMGRDVAHQVQSMMMSAEQKTAAGKGVRLVLSIAGLLFGATGAFVSLQEALNRAWEVQPDPKRGGIRNFIMKRFLSLGMVVGIAFLLLVSLALTAALSAAGDLLFGGFGGVVAQGLNFVMTFIVISVLFAAMFKVLPDAKVGWRDVWVGAVATAILFVVGKFLIGLYIGQSDPGSAFGAAGALAVLLVWIYYAAIIVLLGAEFTQAWMRYHGREIEPEKGAIRVVEVKKQVSGSSPPTPPGQKDADVKASNPSSGTSSGTSSGKRKSDAVVRVQREMAETRDRMSGTVSAIESSVSDVANGVKEKLDASRLVREHPWPALAAAVVAGVALSATRADEQAAAATVDAAKRASSAAADGAEHLRDAAMSRLHNEYDGDGATPDQPPAPDASAGGKSRVARVVEAQLTQLEREIRRASDEIGGAA